MRWRVVGGRRWRRGVDELTRLKDALGSLLGSSTPLRKTRSSREGIREFHLGSCLVVDDEGEVSEEFAPASLTSSEDLG
jgi:hypothetical protein